MKHFTFDSLNIPALGLGTWKSPKGEIYQVIRKSIEIGYRHFDCAFIYQNEAEIGQAIADAIKNGDVLREELFITSKLWNNRHQKHLVQPAIEHTLKDLQLDYLDLYLIHWPVAIKNDINFPEKGSDLVSLSEVSLSETWEGMVQIHSQKLAQNVGVSNFSINKIKNIWQEVGVKPAVNQVEAHPFLQQNALLSFAQENDILLTAYAPLGSADRPAARISANEPQLFETETLKQIAENKHISVAQLLLAWQVNRGVCVIPKSVNEDRLKQNLAAADLVLSAAEMEAIASLDQNFRFIKGDFWCLEGSEYTLENLWDI